MQKNVKLDTRPKATPEIDRLIKAVNALPTEADQRAKVLRADVLHAIGQELLSRDIIEYLRLDSDQDDPVALWEDLKLAETFLKHLATISAWYVEIGLHKRQATDRECYEVLLKISRAPFESRSYTGVFGLNFPNMTILDLNSALADTLRGVPFYRFRTCSLSSCQKLFYAGRTDAKACSKSHSDLISQRAYSVKNREEINHARRENYRFKSKKATVNDDVKNNGTL